MKRRMFSMILAIILLFTSVDVSAFAMEVQERDIVEEQEISGVSKSEETIETEITDDEMEILQTSLEGNTSEINTQAEVLEDGELFGVVYLPEQDEYGSGEAVSGNHKYGMEVEFLTNSDLITAILDDYSAYLNRYAEASEEVPDWLSESGKYGIDLHMTEFGSEMEEENLEVLEYNTTVKVSDVTEEEGTIHLNAVEFMDVIAKDAEQSYNFTFSYKVNLEIDSSQNQITQFEIVRMVDEEGEETDDSMNVEQDDELETMASSMRLRAAEIAYGEVGTTGGSKYWGNSPDNWCVDFAKWCVRQAGLDSSK